MYIDNHVKLKYYPWPIYPNDVRVLSLTIVLCLNIEWVYIFYYYKKYNYYKKL